jgi:hypothetical protein
MLPIHKHTKADSVVEESKHETARFGRKYWRIYILITFEVRTDQRGGRDSAIGITNRYEMNELGSEPVC